MLKSKVVQVQGCEVNGVHVITALCEDGSIFNSYDCNDWVMVEEKHISNDIATEKCQVHNSGMRCPFGDDYCPKKPCIIERHSRGGGEYNER